MIQYEESEDKIMIKHFCDKCGEEVKVPYIIKGKELCDSCSEQVCRWIEGDTDLPVPCSETAVYEASSGIEWHDMRMGFPNERGLYLTTVEFNDPGGVSAMVRISKYMGDPCWYKPPCWYKFGKEFELVEETGGKVTAWAEMPAAYERSLAD